MTIRIEFSEFECKFLNPSNHLAICFFPEADATPPLKGGEVLILLVLLIQSKMIKNDKMHFHNASAAPSYYFSKQQ